MSTRRRNLMIGLIVVGLFIFFNEIFGFLTIVALLMIGYGIYKVRKGEDLKTGFKLLGIGAVLFLLDHLIMIGVIILISLGLFYMKINKSHPQGNHVKKQSFMSEIHWDRDPWVLNSSSMWHVLGEQDIDLSLAIVEANHNQLLFQGIVGDIDLVISEDYGVEIEAFVLFGQIEFNLNKEVGAMNRLYWKSPNYDLRDQKVKIVISYLVGDVDIRFS